MMMSPRSTGNPLIFGAEAGNDSTFVGLSKPRQSRLRVRIAASSVSATLTSPVAGTRLAAAAMASRAVSAAHSFLALAPLAVAFGCDAVIGRHDARHQFMADDVFM